VPRKRAKALAADSALLPKMSHRELVKAILTLCQRKNIRLFHNNTGSFPIGNVDAPRYFRAGLCKGSSDIVGVVTQYIEALDWNHHYGPESYRGVSVFIECKVGRDKLRPEQKVFLDDMRERGCIVGVAHSVEEAQEILGLKKEGK